MVTFTDFLTLGAVLRRSWTSHLLLCGMNDRWVYVGNHTDGRHPHPRMIHHLHRVLHGRLQVAFAVITLV